MTTTNTNPIPRLGHLILALSLALPGPLLWGAEAAGSNEPAHDDARIDDARIDDARVVDGSQDAPAQDPDGSPGFEPEPADLPATVEDLANDLSDPLDQVEQQINAREHAPAANWLETYIDQIEASSHRFDPALVRPLVLLGDALSGLDRHDEALEQYQRAVHLTRVNEGLKAPAQVAIVYREANAYKALGEWQQANGREEYAYHVLTRAHAPLDEALLPGIYHLAQWYQSTHNVFAARPLYEQAVTILETHGKGETPAVIPALQGLAMSYRLERFPRYYAADLAVESGAVPSSLQQPIAVNNFPAGESALQRVVQIRQQTLPDDTVALAESVLDLADWYTLFDKTSRAQQLYAHAWEILDGTESVDVVNYFADPVLLFYPAPNPPSPPPPEQRGESITGYVEVAFDVTSDGQVRSLNTVASEPSGLMDFRVRKSLRLARYRPMLVDGVPVAKPRHTYRHEFPYYAPRTEPEPADDGAVAEATPRGEG